MNLCPIKIFAGGALYQRKPKQAPTTEPQKIESSPTSEYTVFVNTREIVLPTA